jgi:uncharacterized membrane protein
MILSNEDLQRIAELRVLSPAADIPSYDTHATRGERLADRITHILGSWRFLVIQSVLLAIWITLNVLAYVKHWDPYPFIMLNLMLSFQAAYTAPILLMSQNREAQIDRAKLAYYYQVNLKQELEIELLHQKIDALMKRHDVPLLTFPTAMPSTR